LVSPFYATARASTCALLLAAALGLAACTSDEGESSDAPAEPPTEAAGGPAADTAARPADDSVLVGDPPTRVPGPLNAPPAAWTMRTTHVEHSPEGGALVTAFRAAAHEDFDRVVLAFDGAVPGYHVEYVDRPAHTCGSGEEVRVAGDAWLLVRLWPAHAHTEEGRVTVPHEASTFTLPVLREAVLTCDFEGETAWVLGLTTPGGYRITELAGPPRLAIDLRH